MTLERPAVANRNIRGILWFLAYLSLAALPICLLLFPPSLQHGGFWWDLAMAVGFSGLAIMALQSVITARFRRLAAPFGIDIIYYFHRWIAVGGLALILFHYIILRIQFPESLGAANPFMAPLHMTAGRIALLVFVMLVASSAFRKQLRIEYDLWRISHSISAGIGYALAIWHILGVNNITREPLRRSLWLCYSLAWLFAIAHIRVIKPLLLRRKPFRLLSIKPERANSWVLEFEPAQPFEFKFAAGQFAWLSMGSSPFAGKEHPFSFSGSAVRSPRLEFTIKELGDFTRTIKDFAPGTIAYVDGPHGVFTPDLHSKAPGFVLIAGGVGIAPVMSMLRTFADRADRRPLLLIYANRDWDRVIFRDGLADLAASLNLRVIHVLQDPPPAWTGETGLIDLELLKRFIKEPETQHVFFVCGPANMTKSVQRHLRHLGIKLGQIHSEHFEMA